MNPPLNTAKIISLSEHRGSPRLWVEGTAAERSGFRPGERFVVRMHGRGLLLELDTAGDRKVSKKERASGATAPVIDINSSVDLAPLKGLQSVRVVFGDGKVFITPIASEVRRQRRVMRLQERLSGAGALKTAGVAAGGGVLTHAVHTGLTAAGVNCEVAVHNEIREELADHAMAANDALTRDTIILNMPLQELAFDEEVMRRVGEVDIVELGLPCSGASVAGRAKRKLAMPEEHPDVGHLVVGGLALLAKLNPAVAIFENVPQYATTASAALIRQQLRDMGYNTHERELYGPDFGELEARKRWCLVAVTQGVDFELESFQPDLYRQRVLSEVLEAPDAEGVAHRWSPMTGLLDKAVRDKEAGKGFKMQVFDGSEAVINTLTKGISKNRSTDPKISHPEHPELLRVPTAVEHARCKGVPEHLINGLSHTVAHELLGQGIVYGPFQQLARHVGRQLRQWASRQQSVNAMGMSFKAAA